MTSDYETIRRAILFLHDQASRQPSLHEVAETVGLSPAYFQRLFRRWAGVSPKRLLQYVNASEAKRLLRESKPVLDTTFEVGLSSPGRLHDLIVSTDGVTPGEWASYGDAIEIRYGWHDTPFGKCLLAMTERGICDLRFAEPEAMDEATEQFQQEWMRAELRSDIQQTARSISKIFETGATKNLLLHLKGTNFQLKVWEALLRIPEGCITSYSDLADRIGAGEATRAVANAVGANRIAYLIPCHRVLRSTGALGGYRWGLSRKRVMLARELVRQPQPRK
jgi:AraC family transcriptional regulator of adaptative response/methylated-DNA-[protein]-cysteine methyltransferase